MKKEIIILILVCVAGFIFADEPLSMRNVATDGVFEGDWENIYDPINLADYNKMFFFTNLADFNLDISNHYYGYDVSNETSFFEEFPFGIALTNPFVKNLKHSFYIKVRSKLMPDYLGNGHYGEFEQYETTYEDSTGNGIYDVKTITHSIESADEQNDNKLDFIWNNNMTLGDYILGLKFSSYYLSNEYNFCNSQLGEYDFGGYGYINGFDWEDPNTEYDSEFYLMGEDDYYFRFGEEGDFLTKQETNAKEIQLSAAKDMNNLVDNSEIRFDLGSRIYLDNSFEIDNEYYGTYENIVIADTLVQIGNIYDSYNEKSDLTETDFYFGAEFRKELQNSEQDENGFWEVGLAGSMISGERSMEIESYMTSEELDDSLNVTEYAILEKEENLSKITRNGDTSGFKFAIHLLFNLPLNDFARFGFGSYYNYRETCDDMDYTNEYSNISTYQVGPFIDTADEYISTETEFVSADLQSIHRSSNLRVPIALEFSIPDGHTNSNDGFGLRNFVFRLGSTFLLESYEIEDTYDIIESNPNLLIIEYGDGTVYEEHDGNNSLISNKEKIKTVTSTKRFSGGIGYRHSDNVSIDLGGYYNHDTDSYYVGLSFTICR